MGMYEIAFTFWGSAGAFGVVLAALGGVADATWRASRPRAGKDDDQSAPSVPSALATVEPISGIHLLQVGGV